MRVTALISQGALGPALHVPRPPAPIPDLTQSLTLEARRQELRHLLGQSALSGVSLGPHKLSQGAWSLGVVSRFTLRVAGTPHPTPRDRHAEFP